MNVQYEILPPPAPQGAVGHSRLAATLEVLADGVLLNGGRFEWALHREPIRVQHQPAPDGEVWAVVYLPLLVMGQPGAVSVGDDVATSLPRFGDRETQR